jgi:8-oxo-dGTP diphosphatase
MKNFPVIDKNTGREYWISRSIAAVVLIITKEKEEEFVVAVKRGKGTPDPEYVGTYCMPCGYLDFDETITQAAKREVLEETGLDFPISDFKLVSINDNPESDKRQNITFRFIVETQIPLKNLASKLTTKNSEKDEVEDISFIKLDDIESFRWAFNHETLIKEIINSKNDIFNFRYRFI